MEELSGKQLLEWQVFERLEGYPLGARGDWMRAALAASKQGRLPATFLPWLANQKTKSAKDLVKDFPMLFPQKKD